MKKNVMYNFIFTIVTLIVIILLLSFSAFQKKKILLQKIKIEINTENQFITKQQIEQKIFNMGYPLEIISLENIDLDEIELTLDNNAYIKKSQVYKSLDGCLHINIKQRTPIIRIFSNKGRDFYIDNEGYIIPISKTYTSRVLFVSGNINLEYDKIKKETSILKMQNNINLNEKQILLIQLYKAALYIYKTSFWKSQISQFYINENHELEIIPIVGKHRIIIGKIDDIESRLKKLKIFYSKGLNKIGWNNYKKINLKYKNQIICTKK